MDAMVQGEPKALIGEAQRPVLCAQQLKKSYESIDALDGLDMDLNQREILAVVGDNGSGKSTLVRALSGLEPPDSGRILRNGTEVSIPTISDANKFGIVSVFQNPAACGSLTVAENIFMGREMMRGLFLDKKAMNEAAEEILREIGSKLSPTRLVRGLSVGQRKTVVFAQAMLQRPEVLISDEPTASMSVMQSGEILNQLLHMRSLGASILFVSHTLSDIFAISDRICVMRHGRVSAVLDTRETDYETVIAAMAGLRYFKS